MSYRIFHGYIILSLIFASTMVRGQISPMNVHKEYAFSTSLTDYEAININPANLALPSPYQRKYSLSLFKVEGLVNSSPLKQYLFDRAAYHQQEGHPDGFSLQQVMKAPVVINTEITYAGGTIQTKWGNFAFSLKSNAYLQTDFNDFANSVLFQNGFDHYIDTIVKIVLSSQASGKNDSEKRLLKLMNESYIKLNVTHEINLGYSHKVMQRGKFQLFAGVGVKYIMGQADISLKFSEGDINGYVSKISFLNQNLGALNMPADDKKQKVSGNGFGGSLGTTLVYDDKLRVGVSFTDLGFIKWPVNPIKVKDGFTQNVDLSKGLVTGAEEMVQAGIFYYQGKEKNIEILPAKFIMGASYKIHRYIQLYADLAIPLVNTPKNLQSPMAGVGAQFSVLDRIFIKTGPAVVERKMTMPTYINLCIGNRSVYEFSIGTSDLLSYCIASRENIQAGVGVFRMYFGDMAYAVPKTPNHRMYSSNQNHGF